eukprot:3293429-Alexandrium_andersonii.AAC.1
MHANLIRPPPGLMQPLLLRPPGGRAGRDTQTGRLRAESQDPKHSTQQVIATPRGRCKIAHASTAQLLR